MIREKTRSMSCGESRAGRSRSLYRVDPSGSGDGFAPFFAQSESGRLRISCSQCHRSFYPTKLAGVRRLAGDPYCPDCGTDFRVWVAFQRMLTGEAGFQ